MLLFYIFIYMSIIYKYFMMNFLQGRLNTFGGLRQKLKLRPFIYLNIIFRKN